MKNTKPTTDPALFGRAFDEAVHGEINVNTHAQRIHSLLDEDSFKLLVKQSLQIFSQGLDRDTFAQIIANIVLMGYDTGRAERVLLEQIPGINELEKLVLLDDKREDPKVVSERRILDVYKLPE
jgi:hypothetical protein